MLLLDFEIASSFVDDELVDAKLTEIFFHFAYERAKMEKEKLGLYKNKVDRILKAVDYVFNLRSLKTIKMAYQDQNFKGTDPHPFSFFY